MKEKTKIQKHLREVLWTYGVSKQETIKMFEAVKSANL